MKLLALSDLHNNVACVRKLRSQESNDFDLIAIAGDIGSDRADEIFSVLKTFECPIVYIYGNWDSRLPRHKSYGKDCHFVDLKVFEFDGLCFAGFSFSAKGNSRRSTSYAARARECAQELQQQLLKMQIDPRRLVLLTHAQATRIPIWCPGLLLNIYGHVHTFGVVRRGNTTYANVSALDRVLPVTRKENPRSEVYNVNAGNYAVIEVAPGGIKSIECRLLKRDYVDWVISSRPSFFGGPLIPEEAEYGDNKRFL